MRDVVSITCDYGSQRDGIVALAYEAIGRLAARRCDGGKDLQKKLLECVLETACDPHEASFHGVLSEFGRARVPLSALAETYIPEVARILGRRWETDEASFSDVTISLARLHDLLHVVQDRDVADLTDNDRDSAVLLIVPPNEQHTLGAMVAAGILRRNGVSVCMKFAPGLSDLTALLASRQFGAVLITLGSVERLELCAKLVKTLKQMAKGSFSIAVGGASAGLCQDVLVEAGADLVTNDISKVLELFKL